MKWITSVLVCAFILISFISSAQTALVQYTISLDVVQACPDTFCRSVIGCNSTFPCPDLFMNFGDTLKVTFINNLGQNTSVHWHGIFQTNTVEMDGVGFITQCPFANGTSYTYTFTPGQSGTYWYHSHTLAQYADGLRGALVIFDPPAPVIYQYQAVVELVDWYHAPTATLLPVYLASITGNEPTPDSVLINGVGQFNCTTNCLYSQLVVPVNSTIRLRILNEAAMAIISFSIDGLKLTVIEVDGVPVLPAAFDIIRLNVGQRYSVLVSTVNQSTGIYNMRAEMDPSVFVTPLTTTLALGKFVITQNLTSPLPTNVVGSIVLQPIVLSDNDVISPINGLNVSSLIVQAAYNVLTPLTPNPPPLSNVTYPIEIQFAPAIAGNNEGFMTGIHFQLPTDAPLLNYIRSGTPFPDFTNPRSFGYGDVVDVIFFNIDTGEHPIHLHGYNYWVLGAGITNDGPYQGQTLNVVSPLVRDVTSVNPNSWLVIRARLANPGVWSFHCHIDWHASNGIFVVVVNAPELIISRLGLTTSLLTC